MTRAVVIGGGVIGLACAYSLRKRDYEVTLVDAETPGSGASDGNAGWVTPSLSMPVPAPGALGRSVGWAFRSDSPLYIKPTLDPRRLLWLFKLLRNCTDRAYRAGFAATVRLNAETFARFDGLAADGVDFEMHRAGLLFCFLQQKDAAHMLEELDGVSELDYSPTELDTADVRELEPAASPRVRAGIYLAQERQVRPETLVRGYLERLLAEGVDVRVASQIVGFEFDRGQVVGARNGDEIIEGDEFIIAAGAYSGRLARTLGARVPIDAGKGYSLHYEPAPVTLSHALYLYEARVAATPFDGAVRLAGTMEFSGINTRLEPKRIASIAAAAERYLEDWPQGTPGRPWTGMRPMTPDGLPVIGRIAGNVTIASGHAMLGVTLAPVTGDLVARLVAEGRSPDVLRPFDPARFGR